MADLAPRYACIWLLIALTLLLMPAAALAQQPPYAYPITVGTSPVQALPANNARRRMIFVNPNATALVAVCPAISRVNSAPIVCTVNGPGSTALLPYASFVIDQVGQNGPMPSPWNAISDTPGAHLTILELE